MTYPIPDIALSQHSAFLGKTGSGKTSTAKTAIEHVVAEGYRACVLDPIKSDWWGITSSASGKRAGLPFTVFGGPHEHVPLNPGAGKILGELVGKGQIPLSVLDMANFRAGEHSAFFIAFAEALMRHIRGVLYLVLEEAHEFAPKERSGIGNENMSIYWAKKLATAGRSKGIRFMVLTQRTQALHNALLGSCDTMVVHRLTSPADQGPVKKWLKANVPDKEAVAKIESEMSGLPTGTGWLCSGEAKITKLVKFPRIHTFDNSATPNKDSDNFDVKQADVDLEKLRAIIGDAVAEAEANDPTKLKARIAQLEREAKRPVAAAAPPVGASKAELAAEHRRGKAEGDYEGYVRGERMGRRQMLGAIHARLKTLTVDAEDFADELPPAPPPPRQKVAALSAPRPKSEAFIPKGPPPVADDKLSKAAFESLGALAWWRSVGVDKPSRVQFAAIAGIQAGGSTMRSRFAGLIEAGYIFYPDADHVALTEAGIVMAPPATSNTFRQIIEHQLSEVGRETFNAITEHGDSGLSREDLGRLLNVEPTGSTMRSRLAGLSNMELIEYPDSTSVRAQAWVLEGFAL